MRTIETELVALLQQGLPLVSRPYRELADRLGCGEDEAIAALQGLMRQGVVRSFGAFVDYARLGYGGVLCGLRVPEGDIRRVTQILNGRREITHNYLRDHSVNLWCTALLRGEEAVSALADFLSETVHCPFVLLQTVRCIKLKPAFLLSDDDVRHAGGEDEIRRDAPAAAGAVASGDVSLLSRLQTGFPTEAAPFASIASAWGLTEEALLQFLRRMREEGVLRRIGISLHHVRAGYRANALIACDGADPEKMEEAAAAFPWVSHCYVRRLVRTTLPEGWPYRLYVMLHAKSEAVLGRRVGELEKRCAWRDNVVLKTVEELKKTRMIFAGSDDRRDSHATGDEA